MGFRVSLGNEEPARSDMMWRREIPMKLIPQISLMFDGRCEEALRFYEQALGGTVSYMLKYGDSPMAGYAPGGWSDKVAHATLKLGETAISGADVLPGRFAVPQGFTIMLQMDDPEAAERMFGALSEHATRVDMSLQETFWARRFGTLVDQFGVPWSINCE
jgi:PhnB protein